MDTKMDNLNFVTLVNVAKNETNGDDSVNTIIWRHAKANGITIRSNMKKWGRFELLFNGKWCTINYWWIGNNLYYMPNLSK